MQGGLSKPQAIRFKGVTDSPRPGQFRDSLHAGGCYGNCY